MRLACVIGVLLVGDVTAAELRSVTVDRVDGRYVMHSEVFFNTTVEQIYQTMLDWDLSTEFSSVVVESRNLPPNEAGLLQFYVRNEACLMFFCTSFEREGVVEHEPYTMISAQADPQKSDFHLSNEVWRFRAEGEGTVVDYRLEFTPKFFVPPMIGPYMIKRKMKSGSRDAIDRIEAIAQRQPVGGE